MGQLDLMGVREIAARLGVSRSRARQLALERSFPEPAAQLGMGKVWLTADVEAWIEKYRTPKAPAPTPEPKAAKAAARPAKRARRPTPKQ